MKKLSKLKISLCKMWQENRFLVKPFLILCLIYLVGISAILLAGVHYADDIARTNYGYAGWNGFSRYASTLLAYGLHADGYLTNIAPLPQILAAVILALASLILICLVAGEDKFKESPKKWWWYLVAVVPLGLSPYMLECLSYQYDAPYMSISVLAAVVPLLFRHKKWWVYGLAILVGVLLICTTYQAAIGILPMVVILMAIKEWSESNKKNGKQILKFVLFTAVIYLISIVIFQKILMKPRDAYVSNSLPEIGSLFTVFFEHLRNYFGLVVSDFKVLWKVLLALMMLAFVVLFAVRSKRNKILAVVMAMVGVVLMAVFSFAFYAVLEKPLYATRAMYPFGAFIAILGVYVMSGRGWLMILKIPAVILAWCFFVFAFTYGNVLKEQDIYRNHVIDMVISDLNELPLMLEENGPMKNIQVSGSLGYSPVILHMPSDYKILQRLLSPSFSEYIPWMANRVVQGSGLYNLYYSEEEDLTEKDLPILKETVLYNIYGDDSSVLVEFKDTRKFEVMF